MSNKLFFFAIQTLAVVVLSAFVLVACAPSSHPGQTATLGRVSSQAAMEDVLEQAGPLEYQSLVSADWQVPLSGLVNLKHPKAQQAGLQDKPEAIHVYAHSLRHPKYGQFLIDTGVAAALLDQHNPAYPGWILAKAMNLAELKLRLSTASMLKQFATPLQGVFLTHLHLDHISGLPEIPLEIPIYTGSGELEERAVKHAFIQGATDKLLAQRPALQIWRFASAETAGLSVIDVFADASLFVIKTPGHTAGSVSYLARTRNGPVLFVGDTCHTRWGWQNQVEPGDFSSDPARNAASLQQLYRLVQAHPSIQVRLGHQE